MDPSALLIASLEDTALSYPGAWHDTPWNESVVKVGAKIFVFVRKDGEPGITVKVPESGDHALALPGAAPTGYGLGKHGWVTIPIGGLTGDDADVLFDFIDESYRTVANKTMVKQLDAQIATGT